MFFIAPISDIQIITGRVLQKEGMEKVTERIAEILVRHEQGDILKVEERILAGLCDNMLFIDRERYGDQASEMAKGLGKLLYQNLGLDDKALVQSVQKAKKHVTVKPTMQPEETTVVVEQSASKKTPTPKMEGKKEKSSTNVIAVDDAKKDYEQSLLNSTQQDMQEVYSAIKAQLEDMAVFNPKKKYISIRKNKNIAYTLFKKNNLSVIVLKDAEEVKKEVQGYSIRTLTESTQKFWGTPSCEIVIDHKNNVDEVIGLLKDMVS